MKKENRAKSKRSHDACAGMIAGKSDEQHYKRKEQRDADIGDPSVSIGPCRKDRSADTVKNKSSDQDHAGSAFLFSYRLRVLKLNKLLNTVFEFIAEFEDRNFFVHEIIIH